MDSTYYIAIRHRPQTSGNCLTFKSPDLSCETYLSTPQMVARTVTSQNNLKNLLHLTGSAEMENVLKFPTCQSYPALPYTVYRLAGKYSEDDIEESSQVSVPIMTSDFVVSRSKSSSGFFFYRLKIQANNS